MHVRRFSVLQLDAQLGVVVALLVCLALPDCLRRAQLPASVCHAE